MLTAFQANAFQNNAFQINVVTPFPVRPNEGRLLFPSPSYPTILQLPPLYYPGTTRIRLNQSCSMFLAVEDNFSSQWRASGFDTLTTVLEFTRPDGTIYSVTSDYQQPLLYIATVRSQPYLVYNFAQGELDQVGPWSVFFNTGDIYVSGVSLFYIYPP
jgi:hypothetical protein